MQRGRIDRPNNLIICTDTRSAAGGTRRDSARRRQRRALKAKALSFPCPAFLASLAEFPFSDRELASSRARAGLRNRECDGRGEEVRFFVEARCVEYGLGERIG